MSEERQETVADIVAKIRSIAYIQTAESPSSVLQFADRIEAAHKREREAGADAAQICGEIGEMVEREAACHQHVTDYHGLNAAAMREALVMVKRLFDGRLMWQPDIRKAHEAVNAALAAPPRNCDVGTAEEQKRRWHANCGRGIPNCKHCKVYEQARKSGLVDDKNRIRFDCRFIWAQMPYEEGGAE